MCTHKRGWVSRTTLRPFEHSLVLALTLDGAHRSSPGPCSWTKLSYRTCSDVLKRDTYYSVWYTNLAQAQAACYKLGSKCHGIDDYNCHIGNDPKLFLTLCISSNMPGDKKFGSCVWTPPNDRKKCAGLFG